MVLTGHREGRESGMTGLIRSMMLCMVLCFAASHVTPAAAQTDVQMRRLLDSVANPPIEPDKALHFCAEHIDMGAFPEDSVPVFRFRFRNDSESPLVIANVSVSCGCLHAQYDHAPVAAHAEGEIAVSYNPNGHVGPMSYNVFVYTDRSANHPAARLTVKGEVIGTKRHRGYPTAIGALRVKRRKMDFGRLDRNAVATERIACINDSPDTLVVTASRRLPGWASFRTEPQAIAPQGEADLAVTVDCRKIPQDMHGKITCPIYLEGVEAALPERRIDIELEIED